MDQRSRFYGVERELCHKSRLGTPNVPGFPRSWKYEFMTMCTNILTFLQWEKTSINLPRTWTKGEGEGEEDVWVSDDGVKTMTRNGGGGWFWICFFLYIISTLISVYITLLFILSYVIVIISIRYLFILHDRLKILIPPGRPPRCYCLILVFKNWNSYSLCKSIIIFHVKYKFYRN